MSKLQDIRDLAQEHSVSVSGSPRDWMDYMDTASRLYRNIFSFHNSSDAQAVASGCCAWIRSWSEKE